MIRLIYKLTLQGIKLYLLSFLLPTNLVAQCESGGHSIYPADNWLSCSISTNAAGRTGHWIQYDFGSEYELLSSHFWNYNVIGEVEKGFKDVKIDYSLDGSNWTFFGDFSFGEATGGNDYLGEVGPDFGGTQARYLLITAVNNHSGESCSGLGELRINIRNCNQLKAGAIIQDVTCDEGGAIQLNPAGGVGVFTVQWADSGAETYRTNLSPGSYTVSITDERGCMSSQEIQVPSAKNSTTVSDISDLPIPSDTFRRTGIIESSGFVSGNRQVSFQATNSIRLLPGFQAVGGSVFSAEIINCVPSSSMSSVTPLASRNEISNKIIQPLPYINSIKATLSPNPFWDKTTLQLTLDQAQVLNIGIFSLWGSQVKSLASDEKLTAGTHHYTFERANLSSGMYIVRVFNNEVAISKKIVVVSND